MDRVNGMEVHKERYVRPDVRPEVAGVVPLRVTRSRPLCSVIVPTRDSPAQLRACLETLARLDYPRDRLEVLVVDDGGAALLHAIVGPSARRSTARFCGRTGRGPRRGAISGRHGHAVRCSRSPTTIAPGGQTVRCIATSEYRDFRARCGERDLLESLPRFHLDIRIATDQDRAPLRPLCCRLAACLTHVIRRLEGRTPPGGTTDR